MDLFFYDAEDIIGYAFAIAEDIRENTADLDDDEREIFDDLIAQLEPLDGDLVRVSYHPMGAYFVYRLMEVRA